MGWSTDDMSFRRPAGSHGEPVKPQLIEPRNNERRKNSPRKLPTSFGKMLLYRIKFLERIAGLRRFQLRRLTVEYDWPSGDGIPFHGVFFTREESAGSLR